MHDARIHGLAERVERLRGYIADPRRHDRIALEEDLLRTQAELDLLRGIRERNAALVIEAPVIAAEDDARAVQRRRVRERAQKTAGTE